MLQFLLTQIGKLKAAVSGVESDVPLVKSFYIVHGSTIHIRLNTYSTGGLIVCSADYSNSNCEYIFSNGYLGAVHETEDITVSFDTSTYKDITFTNNTASRNAFITCLFPNGVTITVVE